MATVHDLMSAPDFADNRLTEAINIPPYQTGRLAQLGLFTDTPIATTYAKIGVKDGDITIIPARERGGPANKNMRGGVADTLIPIPHFPLDDAITPSDVQNLTVWGEAYVYQTFGNVLNEKLTGIRSKHDATSAALDWGALSGQITDAEGKLLVDLYAQFGITRQSISFALGTTTTDVAAKSRALKSTIKKSLKGAPFTGIRILAGSDFFDAYVGHASVKDAYKFFSSQGPNPLRDGLDDGFSHAGIVIERVDEDFSIRNPDGTITTNPALSASAATAFPLGTPYFKRFIAPPDTIENANAPPVPGAKVFVSTDELPHGKGYDVHTESNVLPVCLRPQVIVGLTL